MTHKGRSADSGHYISWVRKREADASAPYNSWLRFDDDSVSRRTSGRLPLRGCWPLSPRGLPQLLCVCTASLLSACASLVLLQVSEVDTDYITSHLKGGGDDHMAYLLFYKAKA